VPGLEVVEATAARAARVETAETVAWALILAEAEVARVATAETAVKAETPVTAVADAVAIRTRLFCDRRLYRSSPTRWHLVRPAVAVFLPEIRGNLDSAAKRCDLKVGG